MFSCGACHQPCTGSYSPSSASVAFTLSSTLSFFLSHALPHSVCPSPSLMLCWFLAAESSSAIWSTLSCAVYGEWDPERQQKLTEWVHRWLVCVSEDESTSCDERVSKMRAASPVYVPREWMLAEAYSKAEEGESHPSLSLARICGATFGIEHLLFSFTLTLTHSLSLAFVVMMRSKEFKTSRPILMLILRLSLPSSLCCDYLPLYNCACVANSYLSDYGCDAGGCWKVISRQLRNCKSYSSVRT